MQRIQRELNDFFKRPVEGVHLEASETNIRHFKAIIAGPGDSPYQGGQFHLEIFCPEEYPMVPPKVLFRTNIYHPNIDKLGRICLSILKTNTKEGGWSPALRIEKVLMSIQALLSAPNCEDPLD